MSLRGLSLIYRCHLRGLAFFGTRNAFKTNLFTFSQNAQGPVRLISTSATLTLPKKSAEPKRGSKQKTHELSEAELNEFFSVEEMNLEITKSIEHLGQTYATLLALRSNVGSFEQLPIASASGRHLLSNIAQITQKPQMVVIDVSMKPELVGDVKAAIEKSGMNVNPQQDGTSIFVPLPKVTKDHREAMAKAAKTHADKVKEKLRQVGNKYARVFKRNAAGRGDDFVKSGEETISKMVKRSEQQIEALMTAKQRELTGAQE